MSCIRIRSPLAVLRSHLGGVVSRQQIFDLALFVPVDDGPEGLRQVGMRLDGVEFAGFDQGRDGCPVCGTRIVAREESVLSVQGDGSDCSLDGVVVNLDPAVNQEPAEVSLILCDVFQRLTQGGLCGYASAVVGEPRLEVGDF